MPRRASVEEGNARSRPAGPSGSGTGPPPRALAWRRFSKSDDEIRRLHMRGILQPDDAVGASRKTGGCIVDHEIGTGHAAAVELLFHVGQFRSGFARGLSPWVRRTPGVPHALGLVSAGAPAGIARAHMRRENDGAWPSGKCYNSRWNQPEIRSPPCRAPRPRSRPPSPPRC